MYNKGGEIQGGISGDSGQAGAGIYLTASGTVNNIGKGLIFGGQGASNALSKRYAGGVGVDLRGGGLLQNLYLIQGGNGGTGDTGGYGGTGVDFYGSGLIINTADISGGAGGNGSELGGGRGIGIGIALSRGELSNSGIVVGGKDGYGGDDQGGDGMVLKYGAVVNNSGSIIGGYEYTLSSGERGGAGAVGLYAPSGGTVSNYGLIEGGTGAAFIDGTGNVGGTGISLDYTSGLFNDGIIRGGAGGAGENKDGVGGAGVYIEGGATLINGGVITGGAGGETQTQNTDNGEGGVGVYLNGGTLITSGTISSGDSSFGTYTPAIAFGKNASTLEIDPGAVFSGEVLANAADTLDLSGSTSGTIDYLGFQFQRFKTINVEAGSNWTVVDVDNFLSSKEVLNIDGSLEITGNLNVSGSAIVAAGGEWQADGSANTFVEKLTLAGGLLNCGEQAEFIIGMTTTGEVKGAITLDAGNTTSGFGTIATALEGSGTLDVTKGVLFIAGVLGADITASVASGSALELYGGGSLGTSISGAGELLLNDKPYTINSGLAIAELVIDPKTTLSGTGAIQGELDNVGTITASGGKMIVDGTAIGQGTFTATNGATLDLAGGIIIGVGALSGAGTIDIAGASMLEAGLKLAAAHITASAAITLGTGTALTIGGAETFSIDAASGGTVSISGATGDKLTNSGNLAATGPGTADIAVNFVDSKTVSVSSGTLSFLGGITNDGTMSTGANTLSFTKDVTGTGTLAIGTGTLSLLGGAVATQSITFQDSTGLLDLAHPTSFSAIIADFAAHDKIYLLNTATTNFSFAGDTLTLDDGTKKVAALHFTGTFNQKDFAITTDNHHGTIITFT